MKSDRGKEIDPQDQHWGDGSESNGDPRYLLSFQILRKVSKVTGKGHKRSTHHSHDFVHERVAIIADEGEEHAAGSGRVVDTTHCQNWCNQAKRSARQSFAFSRGIVCQLNNSTERMTRCAEWAGEQFQDVACTKHNQNGDDKARDHVRSDGPEEGLGDLLACVPGIFSCTSKTCQ